MTVNRFHDNLIYGFGCLDSSRPLYWEKNLPHNITRVYGRPTNIRQIVSWWGRIKAAWLVFTLDAVAVRWYDEQNAHKHGRVWYELFEGPQRYQADPGYVQTGDPRLNQRVGVSTSA